MSRADPFDKPLADWTDADLESLIGTDESEQFEIKGIETNFKGAGGRKDLAQSVAGLISARGGILLLGCQKGGDKVVELPGIEATEVQVEALLRSMTSSVFPRAGLFNDFHVFNRDSDRKVLVWRVSPDPTGLPGAARGRFMLRMHRETVEMSYDVVRQRFEEAHRVSALGVDAAIQASADAATELRRYLRKTSPPGAREVPKGPTHRPIVLTSVGVAPTLGRPDLGLNAKALLDALWTAAETEHAAAPDRVPGFVGNLSPRNASTTSTAQGVRSVTQPRGSGGPCWYLSVSHDGRFGASVSGLWTPGGDAQEILDPLTVGRWVVRLAVIGLLLVREFSLSPTASIRLDSGTVSTDVWGRRLDREGPALAEPATSTLTVRTAGPTVGPELEQSAGTLATRVQDHVGQPTDNLDLGISEYLKNALRRV